MHERIRAGNARAKASLLNGEGRSSRSFGYDPQEVRPLSVCTSTLACACGEPTS